MSAPDQTLLDVFAAQVDRRGDRAALRYRLGGSWRSATWEEWDRTSREVAAGLIALGVAPGESVALVSSTQLRWVQVDLGILMAGAVTVAAHPSLLADTLAHVLSDAAVGVLFAEDPGQVRKLYAGGAPLDRAMPRKVVVLDPVLRLDVTDGIGRPSLGLPDVVPEADRERYLTWSELIELGRERLRRKPGELDERRRGVRGESVATIVYTSGTTGTPKGVTLTHAGLAFSSAALRRVVPLGVDDEQLLSLPLSHILARQTIVLQMQVGFTTALTSDPTRAFTACAEVRPTFLVSVPLFFERLRDGLLEQTTGRRDLKRRLSGWALGVGRELSRVSQRGGKPAGLLRIRARAAERLGLARLRERLGGRVRFLVSGAAPLDRDVAETLHAAGLLVLEGYGLTECAGAVCLNLPDAFRFGTVGRALPGIEVRIADDGEVLLRGPCVMKGYHRRPEETAAAIDAGGFLHTGDIGRLTGDGFLTITDRKKDLLLTSAGDTVPPRKVEERLERSPYIARAVLVGDGRSEIGALLVPAEEQVAAWVHAQGMTGDPATLRVHPRVRGLFQTEIDEVNARLPRHEQVRRFALLPRDLSERGGELTPTGKLRRRVVEQSFAGVIADIYTD